MKTCRIIGNILVAIVLGALLASLVFIIVDERCSRAESAAHPKPSVQEVPYR